jgi:uncharacterized phage protein (TIGR02220 family)
LIREFYHNTRTNQPCTLQFTLLEAEIMAALPYMQFYVADYLADTGHLTTEEHGAYLLLIFNYWQTGKPLRKDRLSTVARLSNDRWILVEQSLKEFFHDNGETWAHFRIEGDLVSVQESVDKASKAGKASAAARQRKKELKDNARSTRVQQTLNERSTDVPTPTQPSDQSTSDQSTSEQNNARGAQSGSPSGAASSLPAKREAQDDTPVRVIEYLNDKAKRKFPAKGKNLTLVKARIAEGATFEQLTGVVDLKCHAWLNDPKMHEFIRPATLFGQEKFAQYVGQLGMPRPKTKAEELDEAFGLAPVAGQPETMGDVFEGAWKEVFGDRL